MPQHPVYRSQVLDHLGLIAGMFDRLGIDEVIDQATAQNPEMRMVIAGQAVKAMVLSGANSYGGRAPLSAPSSPTPA